MIERVDFPYNSVYAIPSSTGPNCCREMGQMNFKQSDAKHEEKER
jgi:hypothetical protein